jgi:excisionase family DNA binding protein
MTDRLLRGWEVAEQLNVSLSTVLRWAQDGDLPSFQLSNRAIRFRESDVDAWLAGRARRPAEVALTTTPDAATHTLTSPGANDLQREHRWHGN